MKLVLEETIQAPPADVFQVFTDLEYASDRISSIQSVEVLSSGPVGKGTRFRATRLMFGRPATEEMEFTSFDPPRSYAIEGESAGVRFHTLYEFTSSQGGGKRGKTHVTMTMTSRPMTTVAKIVGPLMGLMMTRSMKKAMAQDHAELKAAAEARAVEEA